MSWVIYLKFLSVEKFVLIEYLTLNYIFAYFELLFDCFINCLYIHVLRLTLRKIFFCKIFLWFSAFQCEASGWTWLTVRTQAALPIANLSMDRPDKLVLRPDTILTSIFPPLTFSTNCTPLHFYWFIMTCCVFFSRISPEILIFSAYLFSFHDLLCVFLCSFKFLCFLEFWNICWLEYFFEILCMKILFYLYVRLILIYLGHLDCYICLCIFGIQLTAVILPHCFWN
jgi:hypothetical protein